MGNKVLQKTMHCKADHQLQEGNVCYILFKSGPCYSEGKSVNAKFYKNKVLRKLKKYFKERRPATGLANVRLLHDNASSHKAFIVQDYLKQEKVVELPHPPYSPDLVPCDFFCSRG